MSGAPQQQIAGHARLGLLRRFPELRGFFGEAFLKGLGVSETATLLRHRGSHFTLGGSATGVLITDKSHG